MWRAGHRLFGGLDEMAAATRLTANNTVHARGQMNQHRSIDQAPPDQKQRLPFVVSAAVSLLLEYTVVMTELASSRTVQE